MPDVDDQIRRAIEEGKFTDLPGAGKPIHLDDNPHVNPEWRLAYHLIRNSGFTLPWIEQRQEIVREINAARLALQQSWRWRNSEHAHQCSRIQVETEWQHAVEVYITRCQQINSKIRALNLQIPTPTMQLASIHFQREIERLTTTPLSDRL